MTKSVNCILCFFIISTMFIATACGDSLGIEPNVKKTLLDSVLKPTPPPPPVDTTPVVPIKPVKFIADSIVLQVSEKYWDSQKRILIYNFPWIVKTNFKDIIIDTNGTSTSLTIKLDFENIANTDSVPPTILNHVKAIQVKLDSIPATGSINLNSSISGKNWSMLAVEELSSLLITTYEGNYSPVRLTFYDDVRMPDYGWIRAEFTASFVPDKQGYLIDFIASIWVRYKIK